MKRFVVFGLLLGVALGIMSSSLDILIWSHMGRPEVLVRQGWEDIHIAFMVISGLFAGWLYGVILGQIISLEGLRANAAFLFLATMLVAAALYAAADFVSIRFLNTWAWLCAHVIVFLISLAIARFRSGPLQNKKNVAG